MSIVYEWLRGEACEMSMVRLKYLQKPTMRSDFLEAYSQTLC